ncbi:hypothetical protein TREES_T100000294 [Tupaia chinensis]|uniref:Uncharacterized protein n=1 Tax=Tupaia chinensis TaxID=246437 RepID=L9L4T7_TUPCH|nr:hypothetical protein TREES_T100000294 [Tupaia chinensis]
MRHQKQLQSNIHYLWKTHQRAANGQKPFESPPRRILPGNHSLRWLISSDLRQEALHAKLSRVKGILMTWTRAASEPELGATPSAWLGTTERLQTARALGQAAWVQWERLTLARKNQEEGQMTHCPTSSEVKTQQRVWPLGLDAVAALAPSSAKIKTLAQGHSHSPGAQQQASSPVLVTHFPALKFSNIVLIIL